LKHDPDDIIDFTDFTHRGNPVDLKITNYDYLFKVFFILLFVGFSRFTHVIIFNNAFIPYSLFGFILSAEL